MRSSRANLFRSAPPDRNASPAARPWARTTPRKPSPAGSRGWPWTEARTGSARISPCGLTWRTTSRPSRARAMQVGEAPQFEAGRQDHELSHRTWHRQYAELESKVAEISAANDEAAAALKDVEHRLGTWRC